MVFNIAKLVMVTIKPCDDCNTSAILWLAEKGEGGGGGEKYCMVMIITIVC